MKSRLNLAIAAVAAMLVITVSCHKKADENNNSTEEFANFTMSGVNYNYTPPADSLILYRFFEGYVLKALHKGMNDPYDTYINFIASGKGVNTLVASQLRVDNKSMLMVGHNTPINITEFGDIGTGYVAGNFTATVRDTSTNQTAQMNCTFRVRRSE